MTTNGGVVDLTPAELLRELTSLMSEENTDRLTEWEFNFATDQVERFEKYGEDTRLSEKQLYHTRRIVGKLYEAI